MVKLIGVTRGRQLVFCSAVASMLLGATALRADTAQTGPTFTVTTNDDHNDGTCGTIDCTLREAISAAAANGAGIQFAPSVTGTITINNGELVISAPITIAGPGADVLTLDAGLTSRVFLIANSTGSVSISGLTISNGMAPTTGSDGVGMGGCIYIAGTAFFSHCTINGGMATSQVNASSTGLGYGGGIYVTGTSEPEFSHEVDLDSCTISGNSAVGGHGNFQHAHGGSAFGGGIYVEAAQPNIDNGVGQPGTVHATNCTFSGNSATGGGGGFRSSFAPGGDGGNAEGGAIDSYGSVVLTACTITDNHAVPGQGGGGTTRGNDGTATAAGIKNGASTSAGFSVLGTLIAKNISPSPDTSGAFESQGYNLIGNGDGGQGFNNTGDSKGTTGSEIDPLLGPLADNGGDTKTHALLPGSPAVDKSNVTLFSDQRGVSRPYDDPAITNAPGNGNGSDIGAFEFTALRIVSISRPTNGHADLLALGAPPDKNVTIQSTDSISTTFSLLDHATADQSGGVFYDDAGAVGLTKRFYRFTLP